jgi:hypothetical protein
VQICLRGDDIPRSLLNHFAAVTDHATISPDSIRYDEPGRTVEIPLTRYPLIQQRRVLGNRYDQDHPVRATLTVRNVERYVIDLSPGSTPDSAIMLLFGVQIRGDEVYLCSAQETSGRQLFSLTLGISSLDIELADRASSS